MKTPVFQLHKLSPAELGQFSVMLSSVLTPKQADKMIGMLPPLEVIPAATYRIEGVLLGQASLLRAKAFCEGGEYIACLKELRTSTGGSLKAVKDFTDSMVQAGQWIKPPSRF